MLSPFWNELQPFKHHKFRGLLNFNACLRAYSWFRTGGPADLLFEPQDEEDLACFLKKLPDTVPLFVLGAGSNLLIRDGGIRGVVIKLGQQFSFIHRHGDLTLNIGGATPAAKTASFAAKAELKGFSFLRGIPGTIGGTLCMNGGAYGNDMSSIAAKIHGFTRFGDKVQYDNLAMGFSYRHSSIKNIIFTQTLCQGEVGNKEQLLEEMQKIMKTRLETQPVNQKTGGSTFKNPPGLSAWELIDRAGCRGLSVGAAEISTHHCNFLINKGEASASDLETLCEEVRKRVLDTTGISLVWEIQRIGEKSSC